MPRLLPLLLLALAACGGGEENDASAWVACREYRQLVRDVAAGIATPAEVRVRLQALDRSAQLADDPAVRTNARELLRAATTDDRFATEAARGMTAACAAHPQ